MAWCVQLSPQETVAHPVRQIPHAMFESLAFPVMEIIVLMTSLTNKCYSYTT